MSIDRRKCSQITIKKKAQVATFQLLYHDSFFHLCHNLYPDLYSYQDYNYDSYFDGDDLCLFHFHDTCPDYTFPNFCCDLFCYLYLYCNYLDA